MNRFFNVTQLAWEQKAVKGAILMTSQAILDHCTFKICGGVFEVGPGVPKFCKRFICLVPLSVER